MSSAPLTLLEQAEAAVFGCDIEVIEEQAGMGEGEFTAPDFVGSTGNLLYEGNLLEGGGAVIAFQDTDHFLGAHIDGNMNIQRTDFIRNQCAEGFFMHGGFAVEEDSHGSLLGNVLKGFSIAYYTR